MGLNHDNDWKAIQNNIFVLFKNTTRKNVTILGRQEGTEFCQKHKEGKLGCLKWMHLDSCDYIFPQIILAFKIISGASDPDS